MSPAGGGTILSGLAVLFIILAAIIGVLIVVGVIAVAVVLIVMLIKLITSKKNTDVYDNSTPGQM